MVPSPSVSGKHCHAEDEATLGKGRISWGQFFLLFLAAAVVSPDSPCAPAALQASYLTWGVLQERVMTRTYGATETDPGEKFKDSQFLVFMNRILAFTVAGLYCALTKQPRHGAPMYKYSFASLSNILSSWCQYEALKYISFPTQVLAKASKVIPVMMMGKLVSRKSYEYWEYLTAALISVGVSMFLLSSAPNRTVSTVTTFSGIVLLAGYIIFDSFTSNWQDALFTYKMSPVQMMFGVNVFSCLFTVGSLLEQGALLESLRFMARHSEFTAHAVLLSVCSACGQLFIFYTINQFGAAVFTIIMTLRQAFCHPPLLPHLWAHCHCCGWAGHSCCLPGPLPPCLRSQPHEEAQ